MRCLIVDDSKAVQAIIRRAVLSGYPEAELQIAGDAPTALSILKDFKADIVLTDWHMGAMSGMDLLRQIRKDISLEIKVGFVTTESEESCQEEALLYGASFFLQKPFKEEALHEALASTLKAAVSGKEQADLEHTLEQRIEVRITSHVKIATLFYKSINRLMITPLEGNSADDLRFPSAVSLYTLGSNEVRALCLLDKPALELLCKVTAQASQAMAFPGLVKNTDGQPLLCSEAKKLMAETFCDMFELSRARLIHAKTQLVSKDVPQLREIIKRSPSRKDFSISEPGCKDCGRLTLISR